MIWILLVLLYAPDQELPHTRLEREFRTQAQCRAEEDHYRTQAVEVGGRIVVHCELRVKG